MIFRHARRVAMENPIRRTLEIMRASPTMTEQEISNCLVEEGVDQDIASCLVDYIPMAYTRIMYASVGLKFAQTYRRMDKKGRLLPERELVSEPLWNEVLAYAKSEMSKGISDRDLLAIVYGDAEYKAITQALKDGTDLKGSASAPVIFLTPLENPLNDQAINTSSEHSKSVHKKKIWQFWR